MSPSKPLLSCLLVGPGKGAGKRGCHFKELHKLRLAKAQFLLVTLLARWQVATANRTG
jgi:hypothetical protein